MHNVTLEKREKTAVILMTHFLNELVIERYHKIANSNHYDCIILLDYSKPTDQLHEALRKLENQCHIIPFDTTALKRKYRFFRYEPVIKLFGTTLHRKSSLVPGNNHIPIIDFMMNHDYEYVWNIESDVVFSGDWETFFDAHIASPADLLTSNVLHLPERPDWYWWQYMKVRKAHKAQPITKICSFNPLYRLSKRGAMMLRDCSNKGWYGHHEATMPSIIDSKGLILEDFGGKGRYVRSENYGKWYTEKSYNHQQIDWDAVMLSGDDLLLHPVKEPCLYDGPQRKVRPSSVS